MSFKSPFFVLIIAFLILVSLFPRSVETINGNPVFGIDQGRDYMAAKSIVVDHKFTLIGAELGAGQAGLSYLFHGPGYFYLLTIPFIVFNGNPAGGVVLMLLFGLSAIGFGVYFISKFLGLKEGLLMGFLLALSPYLVGQSRLIENHFPAPLFILLVFYFIWRLNKDSKQSNKFLFLTALTCASIYNLETAIAIPMSITLLIYCVFIFKFKTLNKLPYIFSGFLIALLPEILFESRHGFMAIRSVINYLLSHPSTHDRSANFAIHSKDIFNLVSFTFSDAFPKNLLLPLNLLNFAFIIFILFAIFVTIKEKDKVKKKFTFYLLLLFPVNFLVFLLLRNIVFEHYITDLLLAILVMFVYTLSWLYKNNYKNTAYVISAYVFILILAASLNIYKVSKSDLKDYGGVHKLKGKLDAVEFIYKDAGKNPFGLFVFSPPVYTYPYAYLVWWYGQRKYGYTPYSRKDGTFYLLIEPDSAKIWTYKGWEQTIIKSGKIVFTKTLKSGLIVEKRVAD